jgi:hypothetical protein
MPTEIIGIYSSLGTANNRLPRLLVSLPAWSRLAHRLRSRFYPGYLRRSKAVRKKAMA